MPLAEALHTAIRKHAKQDPEGAKIHGKGDVDEMTIKKADNGFMVTHHKDGDGMMGRYKKPEHHVFDATGHHTSSGDNFHEHIQKFMGCYEPEEAKTGEVSKSSTRSTEGTHKVTKTKERLI